VSFSHAPIAALDPDDAPPNRIVTILLYVVVIGGTIYACGLLISWLWANLT